MINNEYINRPDYDMVHNSVDLETERYGRNDDPLGTDKEKLAQAFSADDIASIVSMLNQGVNSSGQWNTDGTLNNEKYIVRFNVSGVAENYKGGSTLDKNTLTATVTYNDGTVAPVSMDNVTMEGFDAQQRDIGH